jgi:putative FmdB family regulatory protein
MPIYAYRCTNCGHSLDVLRKISDPPLTVCPSCGAPALVKQVTAAGFQLKGSGWYVTDFRGDKKPAKGADAEGGEKAATKAGEGGAEGASNADAKQADAKNGDAKKSDAKQGEAGLAATPAAPAPAAAPSTSSAAPAASAPPAPGGKSGA